MAIHVIQPKLTSITSAIVADQARACERSGFRITALNGFNVKLA
jgi:hypothetical protein